MTQSTDESIRFIARQLLEVNEKLKCLEHLESDVEGIGRTLKMIKGWMDGQEEITKRHSEKTSNIASGLNTVAGNIIAQGERVELVLDAVISMQKTLGGAVELAKTSFDIATATKELLDGKNRTQGGAHEPTKLSAESQ